MQPLWFFSNPLIVSPSEEVISKMRLWYFLDLACLWKKGVLRSLSCSHRLRNFNLQYYSSWRRVRKQGIDIVSPFLSRKERCLFLQVPSVERTILVQIIFLKKEGVLKSFLIQSFKSILFPNKTRGAFDRGVPSFGGCFPKSFLLDPYRAESKWNWSYIFLIF